MGEHLIDGEFQSDKYPWCRRGFVPLKITDSNARRVLKLYADLRRSVDSAFSDDLLEAIKIEEQKPQVLQSPPPDHRLEQPHPPRVEGDREPSS